MSRSLRYAAHVRGVADEVAHRRQRIAIRLAGPVITVNYQRISGPYTVTAIGNPGTLAARFVDTPGGQWWLDLQALYGVQFSIDRVESLTVPASSRVDLSTLFPQRAALFIEEHGGEVHCGASVKQIRREAAGEPTFHLGLGQYRLDWQPIVYALAVITLLLEAQVTNTPLDPERLRALDPTADAAGIGDTPLAIWNIAKWPVVAGFFTLLLAFLNYTTPNAKLRGYRWVTPGRPVARSLWIPTVAHALTAVVLSPARTPPKWTVPLPTRRVMWPRTLWLPDWPVSVRCS